MQDTPKATRLLIVDDHPVVVSGCRSLFASDKSVKIEEAADARTGHRAFTQKRPDVTVIDIKLPDVSGFELMRRIRKRKVLAIPDGRGRRQQNRSPAGSRSRPGRSITLRTSRGGSSNSWSSITMT